MPDTIGGATSVSPSADAEKPPDGLSVGPNGAAEASGQGAGPPTEQAEEAELLAGREDEAEEAPELEDEQPDGRSITELIEQLGRDVSELGISEAQLEAARNMPEVRRAARDVAGVLIALVAGATAFAFLNVAALDRLSEAMATWLAALVLAGAWFAVAGVLLFGFVGRVRHWLAWTVHKSPPTEALHELERERDVAAKATLSTIEELGPALAAQIALAAVPKPGDVVDGVASGVLDLGDGVFDVSEEIVANVVEELPGGGVVSQAWDVALRPGRMGVRVATTVLRRGRPAD